MSKHHKTELKHNPMTPCLNFIGRKSQNYIKASTIKFNNTEVYD